MEGGTVHVQLTAEKQLYLSRNKTFQESEIKSPKDIVLQYRCAGVTERTDEGCEGVRNDVTLFIVQDKIS